MKKILIVEDEEVTSIALETFLLSQGYIVTDCVNSVEEAYKSIQLEMPDLVITDVMLKGQKTGCELALNLYQKYKLSIIFLTAYSNYEILEIAKQSFPLAYVLKPYKEDELKVILELAFHKISNIKPKEILNMIYIDRYLYDIQTQKLYLEDKEINLGLKSKKLLYLLVKNKDHIVSYENLGLLIWSDYDENDLDKLRHLVGRLKEKLNLKSIHSIKSIGYVLRTKDSITQGEKR